MRSARVAYGGAIHSAIPHAQGLQLADGRVLAEQAAGRVMSLPMHPFLTDEAALQVCQALVAVTVGGVPVKVEVSGPVWMAEAAPGREPTGATILQA